MKLVADRINYTQGLVDDLRDGVKITVDHVRVLRELIRDEEASLEKSERIVSTDSYNAQYRKNMSVAVSNSEKVLALLTKALDQLKARHRDEAIALLLEAVNVRGQKPRGPRVTGMEQVCVRYMAETSAEFRKWLKENGHDDILAQVSVAETPAKESSGRDADGNRI